MLKFKYINELNYFIFTHTLCILFFSCIYYYLFFNIKKHYILNNNISEDEYLDNKIINSLFLSINMQTTTGYVDFNARSFIAKLITLTQLFLSLFITLGVIYIQFTKN